MPTGTMPMRALDNREPAGRDSESLDAKTEGPAGRKGGGCMRAGRENGGCNRADQDGETDGKPKPRYRLRPVTAPVPEKIGAADGRAGTESPSLSASSATGAGVVRASKGRDPFLRPAAEDDDGYDPFSDRPPAPEPTFEEDPWR